MSGEFELAQAHCFRVTKCDCKHHKDCTRVPAPGDSFFGVDETVHVDTYIATTIPALENPVRREVYLIGSLRNEDVPKLGNQLRVALPEWTVFDDWHGAGPRADDHWRTYEMNRGRTFEEGVKGFAARNVLAFDKGHLDSCTHAVLVLPAGRSGHLELGYCVGLGKKTFILLDGEYDRWDVMYAFAAAVVTSETALIRELKL